MKTLFTISIIILVFCPAHAVIINIPVDQPTIQAGIDIAQNGDTVLVQPNTYFENISFTGRNIILGSLFLTTGNESYISSTIIDGNTTGSVVTFAGPEDQSTILTGFTIQDGISTHGGGIFCDSSASPTIADNDIVYNLAFDSLGGWGGGIYCAYLSGAVIAKNRILNNEASLWFGGNGGGIYCAEGSNPFIAGNIIKENESGDGGGIYCYYSSPTIRNNYIMNNYVNGYPVGEGGGIYVENGDPLIAFNVMAGNDGLGYGGAICLWYSNASILNNTITGNHTQLYGGGIFTRYGTPVILNTILWGNSAITGNEIFKMNGDPVVTYCDVQGGYTGTGNIDIDPLFRDTLNLDYHLFSIICNDSTDSPCVDAGHPDSTDSELDCDWGLFTERSDMGAFGGTAFPEPGGGGCDYIIGDINNSGGFNGLDITFGVAYFKGGTPPPYECECTPGDTWHVAGDINASCSYNGLDITFGVAYFKGGASPSPCPDCPPAL